MLKSIFSILIIIFTTLLFSPNLFSQISEDGTPISFSKHLQLSKHVPAVIMPPVDVETLLKEDSINDQYKDIPWRFGYNIPVNLNLQNSGLWENIGKGSRIWRLKIMSPGALSINLTFDDYYLPEGAKLFIYNENKSEIIGAFTDKNNKPFRELGTTIIQGQAIIVEYFEPAFAEAPAGRPAKAVNQGFLSIGTVTHGYRDLFSYAKGFGDSGPCNNNVICPVGIPWQDQIRSVALIIVGGNAGCTGALINNTCNDGTPYFLTAEHCIGGSVATWVFRFNWDSPLCSPSQNAPTNQTVSGAILRASNAGSDFGLLEISAAPPASYNVFYAGWDNSGTNPTSQVAIHHPSGDIKKISFDNDPATPVTWGGAAAWEIGNWEDGTTEPGSSGSPLFDQNGRIIGQLYGGTASCASITDDNYGRFDVSWNAGGSPSNQLMDWLDGCNTGVITNDGYDPNSPPDTLDAGISSIISPTAGTFCSMDSIDPVVKLKNYGLDTLTSVTIYYGIDSDTNTYNWTGSLATIATEDIFLSTLFFSAGAHTFHASTSNPNGSADEDTINDAKQVSFNSVFGSIVTLTLITDDYGSETTWDVIDSLGVTLFSGGPYTDFNPQTYTEEFCLDGGCYDFTIYDSFGDGICCGFGNGSYLVENESGDTLAFGGLFTFQETTNFCLASSTAPPIAAFTAGSTTICAGGSIMLIDQSPNSPTSWSWTFPGGTPSSDSVQNPTVMYDTTGVYNVTLIVTNAFGSDTLTQLNFITVNPNPAANFIVSDTVGCSPLTVNFTDLSTGAVGYDWNFGDGSTVDTAQNPTHLFENSFGSDTAYTICLTATTAFGCSDVVCKSILVHPLPVIAITPSASTICLGDSVNLTATGALTYSWLPPTGLSAATGASVDAFPDSTTIYTVAGTDANSCVNSATVTVSVYSGISSAGFTSTVATGCGSLTVDFTNTSTNTLGYAWSFPGGTPSFDSVSDPTVTYNSAGIFDVELIAFGCIANDTSLIPGYITINLFPVVTITPSSPSICKGSSIELKASGANIYNWSPPTGLSATSGDSVTASPTNTIIYTVIGTDVNGCMDTTTVNVTVDPLLAAFTADKDTVDLTISGTVNFTDNTNGAMSWNWDFGDSIGTSASQSPFYTYTTTGIFTVQLIVSNGTCSDTVQATIVVIKTTGIDEFNVQNLKFKVYPNPAYGIFNLAFLFDKPENIRVAVFNIIGEIVSATYLKNISSETYVIDLSEYANGIYYLYIFTDNGVLVEKISIIR